MANLYELSADLLALQEMLSDVVEEDQTLLDTIEAVQGEYDVKMESYAKLIKNLEADVVALKDEANRLTRKRVIIENNIKNLKKAMFDSMKTTGREKVKGQVFTIAIQKNGGKLPVIVDVDVKELPDNLVKVVESPDLEAIAELLEKGESPLAHFGLRGESLRIK